VVGAVVLAGGTSRRFGSDKLAADLLGRPLLHHVLDGLVAGLPADTELIVVGPPRSLPHRVTVVREDPPGGGPAAGLVTGLQAALARGAATAVVVPGDAPGAGAGAGLLLAALDESGADVVVALDATGREQPLQLALTRAGAESLIAAAGSGRGMGESARALVARLAPPALGVLLPPAAAADVDVPADLRAWGDRLDRNQPR